ncbi:MAG: 23S rRNA (adenine(2503)-C(2))-methyltransferase RlmN [Chloroflexi bacterium]|nr:23S rRNA (adenine(2503)-C(2))-methyltransferase RlmN [Chloroflexota bacterium]
MSTERPSIYDLSYQELEETLKAWGQPRYRARQVWEWLYVSLVDDFQAMTNLPKALRGQLAESFTLMPLNLVTEAVSSNRWTRKALFALPDGETVETVLMLYEKRRTLCISSQVGCGMGCPFCATGLSGFTRNLTAGEIVAQVIHYARWLAQPDAAGDGDLPIARPTRVTNVVFMGMGEPMANYDRVWKAIRTLTDKRGFNLGARHITVSTVGLVPGILRMAQEPLQVRLAISLHAAEDELRNFLVPINQRYPLNELMRAVREYIRQTGRRVTFEYALMRGINDKPEHARALIRLLKDVLAHVNLIPLNPVEGSPFQPSTRQDTVRFARQLEEAGIPVTVRLRRGLDIHAGCGQLRRHVGVDVGPMARQNSAT